jgi:hypothetical protein
MQSVVRNTYRTPGIEKRSQMYKGFEEFQKVSTGRLRRGCPPVDPKTLAAIDHAFEGAWSVLATRNLLARFANQYELQEELSQRLAVLASDGVTDPEELRRQALASFPLS